MSEERVTQTRLSLGLQVIKNSLSVLLRGGAQAAYVILVTPYILHRLGDSDFGIWSLINVFVTYAALFDLGISGAFARFVGELNVARSSEPIRSLLSSAMVALAIVCVIGILGFIFAISRYGGQFAGGYSVSRLTGLVSTLFVASMFSNLLLYGLLGIQRQDLGSYLSVGFTSVCGVGAIIVLAMGYKLQTLILFNICATLVMGVVGWFIFSNRVPGPLLKRIELGHVRQLLRFGGRLQLYALTSIFYSYFGKLAVAYSLSLAAVGNYEVALRLVLLVRQGASSLASPLMPATARLYAERDDAGIARFYFLTLKYSSLVSMPVFAALFFFALPIISCWVGGGYEQSAEVLRILAPGFFATTITSVTWFFLVGSGKPGIGAIVSLVETAVGIGSTVLLSRSYGLRGAALGATIAGCVVTPVYMWLLRHAIRDTWRSLIWEGLALPLLLCAALAAAVTHWLLPLASSAWEQLFCVFAYIASCLGAFIALRVVRMEEQRPFREWVAGRKRALFCGGEP